MFISKEQLRTVGGGGGGGGIIHITIGTSVLLVQLQPLPSVMEIEMLAVPEDPALQLMELVP
jgi:hypothetical protein